MIIIFWEMIIIIVTAVETSNPTKNFCSLGENLLRSLYGLIKNSNEHRIKYH
jgi:hypothetical protein